MKKHFTATAYIAAKFNKEYKILLHKHKKQQIWIGVGGHIEEKENPYEAVLREAKEETNLDIKILSSGKLLKRKDVEQIPEPVAILEETIPDHPSEPSHIHIDLIYFAICKNPKKIKMNEDFAWFSKKDLRNKQSLPIKDKKIREEVAYLCQKLLSSI